MTFFARGAPLADQLYKQPWPSTTQESTDDALAAAMEGSLHSSAKARRAHRQKQVAARKLRIEQKDQAWREKNGKGSRPLRVCWAPGKDRKKPVAKDAGIKK